MKKTFARLLLFIVFVDSEAVLLIGCNGDKELTRSNARQIIAGSSQFTPVAPILKLSPAEFECGFRQGLWVKVKRKPSLSEIMFGPSPEVTTKGKASFYKLSPSFDNQYPATATLDKECSRKVLKVTGISDYAPPEGWKGKEVQFVWKWSWDDFPDLAKTCLTLRPEQKGTAVFRHYDDGWRVEEIPLDQL